MADLHLGRPRGRHRNDLLCIYKIQMGRDNGGGGGAWCKWVGHGSPRPSPHSYATVLSVTKK